MAANFTDNQTNPAPKGKSNPPIWIFVAIALVLVALICCLLVVVAILYLQPSRRTTIIQPLPQIVPTLQASPAVPSLPAQPTPLQSAAILDPEARPLFGSTSLQRGFSPDPFSVDAEAGGRIATSTRDLTCGFTTTDPSFTFTLSGGASETFLRIFFTASDGTDTTLVVYTPNQEWKCVDNSSYGGLVDPVMDFDFAPSGTYVVWAGTKVSGTFAAGKLFITASASIAP